MNLRPFISFYGAKWRAAPHYPAPLHDTIIEPFAGSAGYSVRYANRRVVLIEKDERLAALWSWLIRVSPAEILHLPDSKPGQDVRDLGVCDEAEVLIGFWINPGSAVPKRTPSKRMRDRLTGVKYNGSGSQLIWSLRVRERIAAQVEGIRHWRVIHGDYTRAPDLHATWFVDPLYYGPDGQHYRERVVDYAALAKWIRKRHGQVIACEQAGAEWLPFRPFGRFKASVGRQKGSTRYVSEAIWYRKG